MNVWLVNTGWTGGSYGTGHRMKLAYTRCIIDAIHAGDLANAPAQRDPIFGLHVVTRCQHVPDEMLIPRNTWKDSAQYDQTARKLAELFKKNFEQYASMASPEVKAAGPQ